MGCVGIGVRKDMAELELNPSRDTQNNRKGFYSKGLSDRVAKPLSRVLERSRHSCEVPDVWEKGNIVPFFRQSGKEDPGNSALSASLCAWEGPGTAPPGSSAEAAWLHHGQVLPDKPHGLL